MAIVRPLKYTAVTETETGLNRPVSEELIRKICQNINLLGALAIPGPVVGVAINMPGVPTPTVSVWQSASGSEITNVDSPFQSIIGEHRFTPDMRGRFIRGANAGTLAGNEAAGSSSGGFTHDHGGATQTYDFTAPYTLLGVIDHPIGTSFAIGRYPDPFFDKHDHIMAQSVVSYSVDPIHLKVQFYLKIN